MNLLLMGRRRGRWSYLEDNFTRADGALGVIPGTSYAWDADSWAIASNKAVVTPTLLDEMLTDPGFEGTYTDGLCAGWSKTIAGAEPAEETTIVHGGSKSQKITADAINEGVYQIKAGTVGVWYTFSAWVYRASGSVGGLVALQPYDGSIVNVVTFATAAWAQGFVTCVAGTANKQMDVRQYNIGDSVFYVDDVSLKPMTFSTLIALANVGASSVNVQCAPTIPTATAKAHIGVIVNCDADKRNFVLGLHNGVQAQLYKGVWDGSKTVYTQLISVVAAYSAAAPLRVVRTAATTFQLWYNGTQAGTDQTISDAGIVSNTYHGVSSTHANCIPGTFRVERA